MDGNKYSPQRHSHLITSYHYISFVCPLLSTHRTKLKDKGVDTLYRCKYSINVLSL
jgi:hypothetical protein